MSRLSLFNSPLLLGFDHFERTLDRISKTGAEGYPPYNIEQVSDEVLRITLAVAGFAIEDLEIQIEDNQLVVRGRQKDDSDRIYLHRGIAARQFQRSFVLAEGIEVTGASLDNGLLSIELARPKVEPQVRTVPIKKAAQRTSDRSNGAAPEVKHGIAVTGNAKS
jgi:HSP20 family molecular chaperone IbpA